MHIVTVDEMRALEKEADERYGLDSATLMENAGRSAAEILSRSIRRQRAVNEVECLILVGPGNNGGDGLVMGRYLQKWGARVSIYRWKEQRLTIADEEVPEQETVSRLEEVFSRATYIIDALLGTGRSRPLPDSMRNLLARARDERARRDTTRIQEARCRSSPRSRARQRC